MGSRLLATLSVLRCLCASGYIDFTLVNHDSMPVGIFWLHSPERLQPNSQGAVRRVVESLPVNGTHNLQTFAGHVFAVIEQPYSAVLDHEDLYTLPQDLTPLLWTAGPDAGTVYFKRNSSGQLESRVEGAWEQAQQLVERDFGICQQTCSWNNSQQTTDVFNDCLREELAHTIVAGMRTQEESNRRLQRLRTAEEKIWEVLCVDPDFAENDPTGVLASLAEEVGKITKCSTNVPDQPRYTFDEDYLTTEQFDQIQAFVDGHPMLQEHSPGLAEHLFSNTLGLVVRANETGLEQLRSDKRLEGFVTFFDKARIPGSNYWQMNILVCSPTDAESDTANDVVKAHVDTASFHKQSLGITQFAHEVHVAYMVVPEDLRGGELELLDTDDFDMRRAYVTPKANSKVVFRGDQPHKVNAFYSAAGQKRISLVLENYKVPPKWLPYTTQFEISGHEEDRYV